MEQPREPKFYPNELRFDFQTNETAKTLQSIDSTLKRIEKLIDGINVSLKNIADAHKPIKLDMKYEPTNIDMEMVKGCLEESKLNQMGGF